VRIDSILIVDKYTILSFTTDLPSKRDYVTVDGKAYATITAYDMPRSIGVQARLQAEGEDAIFS